MFFRFQFDRVFLQDGIHDRRERVVSEAVDRREPLRGGAEDRRRRGLVSPRLSKTRTGAVFGLIASLCWYASVHITAYHPLLQAKRHI